VVKVADGFHLWSQTYDRELTDIFAVQDEIARSVVSAARRTLVTAQAAVPGARRTGNHEAYTQFLLGRQFLNRGVIEDYRRSVEAYERAIALDPSYAPAHADLSEALALLVNAASTTSETRISGQQQAFAEAEKAVELAPDLAEAHRARGIVRMTLRWDWSGARADLQRALELAPGDARAQLWLGQLFAVLGQLLEAITATRKAVESDPLEGDGWDFLGRYLAAAGDLEESRKAFRQALRILPDSMWVQRELAFTYLLSREPAAALASFEKQEGWIHLTGLALAHHDLGHPAEARKALDALVALADPPTYQIAQILAWWGDRDRAIEWLERGRAAQDAGLRYATYDPLLHSLRGDPRFAAFLQKMKLPVQ